MAEMKTRAAAALTAFGLACGGMAINNGSAGAAPTSDAGGASGASEVQTDAASRYKLVFSDNFNGRKLGSSWASMDLRAPTRTCSLPDPRLHSVKNGKLKLEV